MYYFSFSEKQWIISFLLFDVLFWSFVFGGCVMNPINCLEIATFGPAFFYAPFWLLAPDFSTTGGYTANLVAITMVGILCHALLGFGVGRLLQKRKKSVSWSFSIPLALIMLLVIIGTSSVLALMTGMMS